MTARDDAEIDVLELLELWWRHEQRYQHVRGYPSTCASTRDWRASRQWDDFDGALDAEVEVKLAQRVGFLVSQIEHPWRTALHILARNRVTGSDVWQSPRLPEDRQARIQITSDAVDMLRKLL